jgi:hypothetical protein
MIINRFLTYIIITVFISISTFAIYSDLDAISKQTDTVAHVKKKLHTLLRYRAVIKELQKERGLTNIYFTSKIPKNYEALKKQRETFFSLITADPRYKSLQNTINNLRHDIDNNSL